MMRFDILACTDTIIATTLDESELPQYDTSYFHFSEYKSVIFDHIKYLKLQVGNSIKEIIYTSPRIIEKILHISKHKKGIIVIKSHKQVLENHQHIDIYFCNDALNVITQLHILSFSRHAYCALHGNYVITYTYSETSGCITTSSIVTMKILQKCHVKTPGICSNITILSSGICYLSLRNYSHMYVLTFSIEKNKLLSRNVPMFV